MSTLTAQAEALLDDAGLSPHAPTAVQLSTKLSRLDATKLEEVLAALEDNLSAREVSRRTGVSHVTVGRIAAKLEELTEGARKLLGTRVLDAVDDWARASSVSANKGDHRAAKDLLMHTGVIEPLEDSGSHGAKVNVLIGIPGAPVPAPSVQVTQDQ